MMAWTVGVRPDLRCQHHNEVLLKESNSRPAHSNTASPSICLSVCPSLFLLHLPQRPDADPLSLAADSCLKIQVDSVHVV